MTQIRKLQFIIVYIRHALYTCIRYNCNHVFVNLDAEMSEEAKDENLAKTHSNDFKENSSACNATFFVILLYMYDEM